MLVLKTHIGDEIRLFDTKSKAEVGQITRLNGKRHGEVLLGFDMPESLKIIRNTLICGKENRNVEHTGR